MLTPCDPCSCPGAPCEQCMFGYQSAETNHELLYDLIKRVESGEKPIGYGIVTRYKNNHKDWKLQMGDDTYKSKGYHKNNVSEPLILEPEDCSEFTWNRYCKLFGISDSNNVKRIKVNLESIEWFTE